MTDTTPTPADRPAEGPLGPITPIRCTEPGCHWACHGVPDKYADSRARIVREHLAAEHAPTPEPAPAAVWVDGDSLMEAMAAAVYEQCDKHPEISVTIDDPRNIAAVAATVARQLLGTSAACPECGTSGACNGGPCPLLTAEEARDQANDLATQLYRAQDALAFVGECCDIADREQRPVTTGDVREWLKGARCGRQLLGTSAAEGDRRCVCGDPIEWMTHPDGPGWIHSPGSDTRCLDARPAAAPPAPADRAAVLRWVAATLDGRAAVLKDLSSSDYGEESFAARELTEQADRLRALVDEAEYVATPCSVGACEPGGEPCTTHERLMAHAEGDHELCDHEAADAAAGVQPPTREADAPVCGDQYDESTCQLDPGHTGSHADWNRAWDYGRATPPAAPAAPEETQ
ncbi:hypothetical protein ACIBQ3_32300 [Streptomyces rubiginosohelvolus]|uniref:hypothetical protein n=1 Tax=Streptomyces rubiginosohelvolus TaxID=67362 RepID=UPI00378BBB4B